MIAKAVNNMCETSCDAEVLRNTDMDIRQSYAETIIGILKYQSKHKTAFSTSFYGGNKSMKARISSIMDTGQKKVGVLIAALVLTLAMGTGCVLVTNPAQEYDPADAILVISEETFIEQVDNIRISYPEEHLGKKIKIEGLYIFERSVPFIFKDETGAVIENHMPEMDWHFVGRRLDHEYDFEGWVGFGVLWDGERPENDSWVEAVGVWEFREATESTFGGYMLNLTSLTVLEERGLEILTRTGD
jgi:hypothetical protein